MAHKRKIYHRDENCLNCGYPIIGNYCGECGQKAHLHKDSLWHMIAHFIGDYFHYDNKFWRTIKTMFTKPGLITKEYIEGKRVKYLNPIQLYIFVTTVFFLSAYSVKGLRNKEENITQKKESPTTIRDISDSIKKDTDIDINLGIQNTDAGVKIGLGKWTPKESSLQEYDSVQQSYSEDARDGFFKKRLIRKSYQAAENNNFTNEYKESLRRNIPKVFFILLPFFAFLLKLVYIRHRSVYIDHIIFSMHFHSFAFLFVLIFYLLAVILNNEILDLVLLIIFTIGLLIYLLISLRRVYNSPWWKTLIKHSIILTAYFFSFIVVLLLLLSYSFLTL